MPSEEASDDRRLPILGLICGGLIPIAVFWSVGRLFLRDWVLDLGSFGLPTPYHTYFLLFFIVLGTAAAVPLGAGLFGLVHRNDRWERLVQLWRAPSDRQWMIAGGLLACLVPALLRWLVLDGTRLTDDESAYLFMARLLADGQLTAAAPDPAPFFDRFAMVNGEAYYAQYFLGWPALLAPFAALGVPGLANPVYAGVTAVGLFLVGRRLLGSDAARAVPLLWVLSPFAMFAAATQLSHVVCAMWLVWMAWAYWRNDDGDAAPLWQHALLATCFSMAFFTRPTVALGIGGPFLAFWLVRTVRRHGRDCWRPLLAFGVPALLFAGLFLAVNKAQNGAYFTTAYEAFYHFRIEHLTGGTEGRRLPNFDFAQPTNALALTGIGLMRFGFALWGAPLLLLLAGFAGTDGWRRLLWASVLGFLAVHFPMTDSGADSFGPVHYFGLVFPTIILTAAGLTRVCEFLEARRRPDVAGRWRWSALPICAAAALLYVGLVMYLPVRAKNLRALTAQIGEPSRVVNEKRLQNGVIFVDTPFVKCASDPDGFVGWPPYNSPGFDDELLWVNHLTLAKDRAFLRGYAPEKPGFLLVWTPTCRARLLALDELSERQVRPGRLERIGRGASIEPADN